MTSNARWIAISGAGVVVLLGLLALALRPILQVELYVPSDINYARAVLPRIRELRPRDIKEVVIIVNHYDTILPIRPDTDGADIEAILRAVKGIQVADKLARVDPSRDKIEIITYDKYKTFGINGCFDPARAPIISPAMRSDDLSRIVQDIVKRKGKRHEIGKPRSSSLQ
ncbi:MAG: hypothetical protein HYX78_08655 [Armatimonadetes bacterium]|nr:hypothetical protein [Armatimonadota bacterium]